MKTLLTILTCIMVASCKNDGESVEAEVLPQAKETLSAELQNARLLPDQSSIAFDFVITNNSAEPVSIAERWNSWGARQWTIRLKNSDGSEFDFINPQSVWYKNSLTVLTIDSKKQYRGQFKLTLKTLRTMGECHNTFATSGLAIDTKAHFAFPLSLVGTFSADDIHKAGEITTNWKGTIKTPEVVVKN